MRIDLKGEDSRRSGATPDRESTPLLVGNGADVRRSHGTGAVDADGAHSSFNRRRRNRDLLVVVLSMALQARQIVLLRTRVRCGAVVIVLFVVVGCDQHKALRQEVERVRRLSCVHATPLTIVALEIRELRATAKWTCSMPQAWPEYVAALDATLRYERLDATPTLVIFRRVTPSDSYTLTIVPRADRAAWVEVTFAAGPF